MTGARTGSALAASALLLLAGSDAASQSGAPSPPGNAADLVVVSRIDNTQTVEAADLPLVLTKAGREEHAVVRRLIFIIATLRLTEAAAPVLEVPVSDARATDAQVADAPPEQTCRWSYKSFLQRQICFTSMTGLSSCTQPEVTGLPDEANGDAPLSQGPQTGVCNDIFRPAVNARIKLSSSLLSRSKELFAADQRSKVAPLFKASGVTARPEAAPVAAPAPK
jgi:hypothetical protein